MSKKRKKKSPLRDEFTDALNEEIAERKIIERTQPKEEIFQKTVTLEKAVEVAKVSLEKIPAPPVQVEEIKIEVPPQITLVNEDLSVGLTSLSYHLTQK